MNLLSGYSIHYRRKLFKVISRLFGCSCIVSSVFMPDYSFDFIGVGADLLIDCSCSKALALLLSWI